MQPQDELFLIPEGASDTFPSRCWRSARALGNTKHDWDPATNTQTDVVAEASTVNSQSWKRFRDFHVISELETCFPNPKSGLEAIPSRVRRRVSEPQRHHF